MFITLPGKKVATVRVISCAGDTPENEVSFCELVDGSLPTMDDREEFAKLFVQEIKSK